LSLASGTEPKQKQQMKNKEKNQARMRIDDYKVDEQVDAKSKEANDHQGEIVESLKNKPLLLSIQKDVINSERVCSSKSSLSMNSDPNNLKQHSSTKKKARKSNQMVLQKRLARCHHQRILLIKTKG
jgi:hypothetical protein